MKTDGHIYVESKVLSFLVVVTHIHLRTENIDPPIRTRRVALYTLLCHQISVSSLSASYNGK